MTDFINQPSMAAGEIAPDLYGRVDLGLYNIGLRTCKNFVVRQYGGVSNRPGTKFIAEVKDHSKKVRLIDFQFNEEQTYVLEFGNQYMRVIKDGAVVVETAVNITAATQADPVVVTATAHGYSNGDDVYISGITGMTELNGRTFRVANVTANTFELTDILGNDIDGTGYAAYSSGGTSERVYTVTTPWLEADLFELNFTQSNDVLTVVHEDYFPRDITRTDHDAWTVSEFDNTEGPFKDINIGSTTIYAGAATGSTTLTASAALFTSDMVGDLIYLEQEANDDTARWEVGKTISTNDVRRAGSHYYEAQNSSTTGTYRPDHIEGSATDGDGAVEWEYLHSGFGVAEITAYSSSTSVTVTVRKRLPDNVVGASNTTTIWALAAWSVAEGYPQSLAYHKQRMWFGGTTLQPNGLWISGAGLRSYFGRSNPILDDDAITLKLDTTQVNAIRHLLPLKQIIALTSSSEQLINGVDNLILATDPPVAVVQGYTGASKVKPIIIGNTALFVQDIGAVVRSLAYSLDSDSFSALNLSARSPHLFRNRTVVDWGYHRHPLSVIWAVRDDGAMLGFTIMQEQQVLAWHRHETDGLYESVACIREGNETATYIAVKRTINGNTVRYIERMESREQWTDDATLVKDGLKVRHAYFVDCGLTYNGINTSATTMTITGGTEWDSPEELTLTASASTFESSDVGDYVNFWYTNDNGTDICVRLQITAYSSATAVTVIPSKEIPTAYRATAFTDWEFARDTFGPLHHLEGKEVAILADGAVVEGKTVSGGEVTIDTHAAVVHIGLPYTSDIETLDVAQPDGLTKDKTVNIARIFLTVQESRAVFVTTNGFNDLTEIKQRSPSIGYDLPIPAETEVFEVQPKTRWSKRGRIGVRQSRPLPITVNSITLDIAGGYS